MHRFFAEPSNIFAHEICLSREDVMHIRAIRLRPEELFVVCDGAGTDYICRLIKRDSASYAEITDKCSSRAEPDIKCSVFVALMKGQKLDAAVQKSVELGAFEINIFPSKRTQSSDGAKKIQRLQKIALEAAKQSHRGIVPNVAEVRSFEDAVSAAVCADVPLFFYEHEEDRRLKDELSSNEKIKTVSILTGPEGGFAPEEAEHASSCGMQTVTLGPRILRCETAPIAALSAVMYHTGNL